MFLIADDDSVIPEDVLSWKAQKIACRLPNLKHISMTPPCSFGKSDRTRCCIDFGRCRFGKPKRKYLRRSTMMPRWSLLTFHELWYEDLVEFVVYI